MVDVLRHRIDRLKAPTIKGGRADYAEYTFLFVCCVFASTPLNESIGFALDVNILMMCENDASIQS